MDLQKKLKELFVKINFKYYLAIDKTARFVSSFSLNLVPFSKSQYTFQTWVYPSQYTSEVMVFTNGDFNVRLTTNSPTLLEIKFISTGSVYSTNIANNVWTFIHVALDSNSRSVNAYVTNVMGTSVWKMSLSSASFTLSGTSSTLQISCSSSNPVKVKAMAVFSTYMTINPLDLSYVTSYLNTNFLPWNNSNLVGYFDCAKIRDGGIMNLAQTGVWSTVILQAYQMFVVYDNICTFTVSSISCYNNCTIVSFVFPGLISLHMDGETGTPQQQFCYKVFAKKYADLYFGDNYSCNINGNALDVYIGNNWKIEVGNVFMYNEGGLFIQDCPFSLLDPTTIVPQNYNGNTPMKFTVSTMPSFTASVDFTFSFQHENVSACNDLIISIGNIYGLAKRNISYLSYTCIVQAPTGYDTSPYTNSQTQINGFPIKHLY